jgi:predicted TIM-barrel fold metal-dependent hydrolase
MANLVGTGRFSSIIFKAQLRATLMSILWVSVAGVATKAIESSSLASSSMRVIDSHVHVWADAAEASSGYPYAVDPPSHLKDAASVGALLSQMDRHGVAGALVVQPINHKFNHAYVQQALERYPDRFKGMLLHDPSMTEAEATALVREYATSGFVGVRFNPYLWPKLESSPESASSWVPMSSEEIRAGLAVYKLCGELGLPVGIMCMQGLGLHVQDIEALILSSPKTALVLDHFGFTFLDGSRGQDFFDQMLQLAQRHPQVSVKISAPSRLFKDSTIADFLDRVRRERFLPLLQALGSDRLLFGTDFPYVLDHSGSYGDMVGAVASWIDSEQDRMKIMGGNAERLFGTWGKEGAGSVASEAAVITDGVEL